MASEWELWAPKLECDLLFFHLMLDLTVMATPTCARCKHAIPSEDINVAQDVAYCRACNLSFPLSSLTHGEELETGVELNNPPVGTWRHTDMTGTIVGATHRALSTALSALLFGVFWNGIVSIFVLLALGGTLQQLHLTVPSWFPAPKMNGGPMTLGLTIFLWLFLTPFIAIGLAMVGVFVSSVAGRTEVRIGPNAGEVFTGIGPLGMRRRFVPGEVKALHIDDKEWCDSKGNLHRKAAVILDLVNGKQLKFGSMLTPERRKFMAAAVRQALPR